MEPEKLGEQLRSGADQGMKRRRAIIGLSLFNIASMAAITLYQVGILRHVPEPDLPGADADKVNGSAEAYSLLQTPDAALAIGSYAATLGLAAMGPPNRSETMPWVPLAMCAKTIADAALAAKGLIEQPRKYRAYCLWCVFSAIAAAATVPLALPEAGAAIARRRT